MPYTTEQVASGEGNVADEVVINDGRKGVIVGYGYEEQMEGRPFLAFIKLYDGDIRAIRTVDPATTKEEA